MKPGSARGLASIAVMAAVLLLGPTAIVVPEVPSFESPTTPPAVQAPVQAEEARAPAPAGGVREVSRDLPWVVAESTIPAAPGDAGSPYSGVLAAPKADGLTVHAAPGKQAFGRLPVRVVDSEGSDRTWLPVVGDAAGEWLQVLLPARRNLPSSGLAVNGATGWVRASDIDTKNSPAAVEVDLAAKTITVAGGAEGSSVFPVSISGGDQTARGRAFVMGRYTTELSKRCSAQPMLILSAQSQSLDGYFGQATAVQAIHAFSNECRRISGYTRATPGCIIANEGDIPRLLTAIPDGTPITVRG